MNKKRKLEAMSVICRICGAKKVTLYKDEVNPDVRLCKSCKDFLTYERKRQEAQND